MPSGTVKFFNDKKGFGFITADEGSQEIFLPAASLTASGLTTIVAGQRVTFETQADKKGPKAVEIKIIPGEIVPVAPRPAPAAPAPRADRKPAVTLYHNPDSDLSCDALEDLRDAGIEPRVVEYLTTPMTAADLRKLSLLLRESDQSLVRKYDNLFFALQLDDRFIGENEFWQAIVEHPTLINGPILATQNRAALLRNEQDIQNFIGSMAKASEDVAAPQAAKGLSPRLLQLMAGSAIPRPKPTMPQPPEDEPVIEKPVDRNGGRTVLKMVERSFEPAPEKVEAKIELPPAPAPAPVEGKRATLGVKKPEAKPEAKIEKMEKAPAKKAVAAKPAPKAAAKKPAAAKPVKKAVKKK